jgi:ACS family glucarate transporter-like MFS transporter
MNERATATNVRWILIGWIFLLSAVGYLDRVNIGIAGGAIMNEFHLDKVQFGWIQTFFVGAYALFQAPAGRLADRFGPRKILALAVIWWGLFTSLITVIPALASAFVLIIAIRFGLGIGEAVMYPAANKIVAAWIPSRERGLANGIIFAGVGFGAGVTPPLITHIMSIWGWRASFWCSSLIGLLAGTIWYLVGRDTPREHPWVNPTESQLIETGLPPAETVPKARLSWSEILSNKDVVVVTLSYFTYGYAAFIFFGWFFIYLNQVRGVDFKKSAVLSVLPFIAMAVGSSFGGWLSDVLSKAYGKRTGRSYLAAVSIGLSAILIALGTRIADTNIAVIYLAGGAGALYLSQSSFWSVSADIGKHSAGSVSGVMNMGAQTGSAITATLTPWIGTHFGWNSSFLVAAALCACGAFLWLFVNPIESQSEAQRERLRTASR